MCGDFFVELVSQERRIGERGMDEIEKERETEGGVCVGGGGHLIAGSLGRQRGMMKREREMKREEEKEEEGGERREGRWEVKCHLIPFCVCTQN